MSDVTPQSILSLALVGANPYQEAERILGTLERHGWTVAKKPRMSEPGLWGVVEGRQGVASRRFYVHLPNGWAPATDVTGKRTEWERIIDPVLIREGVES